MYNPVHGTLVTTLAAGDILVVVGVTPPDGLLTKSMRPVVKYFVTHIIIIIIIIAPIKGSAPVLNSLMEYLLIA